MFKIRRALIALVLTTAFYVSSVPPAVYLGTGLGAVVITQAACPGPKDKSFKTVAEAAKDIGGGTRDVIKAVGEAYDKGLITTAQKDKFADLLRAIARGGKKGVDVLDTIQKAGLTEVPADKQQALNLVFSDEVITPYLTLLTELGKLSETQSAAIRAALVVVRTAILLLSNKLGRNDVQPAVEHLLAIHAPSLDELPLKDLEKYCRESGAGSARCPKRQDFPEPILSPCQLAKRADARLGDGHRISPELAEKIKLGIEAPRPANVDPCP